LNDLFFALAIQIVPLSRYWWSAPLPYAIDRSTWGIDRSKAIDHGLSHLGRSATPIKPSKRCLRSLTHPGGRLAALTLPTGRPAAGEAIEH